MAFVEIRKLWVRYGPVKAVQGISFDIPHGEVFGFIGPNGAGKIVDHQGAGHAARTQRRASYTSTASTSARIRWTSAGASATCPTFSACTKI